MTNVFPVKRVLFWGGVAAIAYVLQLTGVGSSDKTTDLAASDDNVVMVQEDDPKMALAETLAKKHLAKFLSVAESAPASWEDASVKVAMQAEGGIENIWVGEFQKIDGTTYRGRLANEPVCIPGLHLGDMVTFSQAQIGDWAYVENGKGYGYYSVRALMDRMPQEQVEMMTAFLSPNPVPTGW